MPELGSELAGPSSSGAEVGSAGRPVRAQSSATASHSRRGRSPADKEHKRLKRSLQKKRDLSKTIFENVILTILPIDPEKIQIKEK